MTWLAVIFVMVSGGEVEQVPIGAFPTEQDCKVVVLETATQMKSEKFVPVAVGCGRMPASQLVPNAVKFEV